GPRPGTPRGRRGHHRRGLLMRLPRGLISMWEARMIFPGRPLLWGSPPARMRSGGGVLVPVVASGDGQAAGSARGRARTAGRTLEFLRVLPADGDQACALALFLE